MPSDLGTRFKSLINYQNPVRDASVSFGRIDQGVDYSGTGPIRAIGSGTIVGVYNSGWPGGTFIDEHLNTGGYWYVAEDVTPNVNVGDRVKAGDVIGELSGGTEMGWAAPGSALAGESLAHYHGNYAFPTPEGTQANTLLTRLGAPGPNTKGPIGPKQPQQAQTTSFVSGLLGGILGGTNWKDTLERAGLIFFGAALVLIGIWMLAGKQAVKLTTTVVAPEATAASTAASKAKGSSSESS